MNDNDATSAAGTVRYAVTGMDCPSCVGEIERATRAVPGVKDVRVSLATQTMCVRVDDKAVHLPKVERAVLDTGHQLTRLTDDGSSQGEEGRKDLSHVSPAYKRTLWIVVGLNLGYGIVEMAASFIASSQSLQADALDFLGDGLISFLGLLAARWSLRWRARAALLQGIFLGGLGLSVLAGTVYRVFILNEPEAELMGIFGAAAFAVNVAAAAVLIPHRSGDANMRAVWLFSRNDAIGNLAVILAAGLVAWTGTPWPDLVVAVVIAGLFLHSAISIVIDARKELAS